MALDQGRYLGDVLSVMGGRVPGDVKDRQLTFDFADPRSRPGRRFEFLEESGVLEPERAQHGKRAVEPPAAILVVREEGHFWAPRPGSGGRAPRSLSRR
jgi:hypothetical protein